MVVLNEKLITKMIIFHPTGNIIISNLIAIHPIIAVNIMVTQQEESMGFTLHICLTQSDRLTLPALQPSC